MHLSVNITPASLWIVSYSIIKVAMIIVMGNTIVAALLFISYFCTCQWTIWKTILNNAQHFWGYCQCSSCTRDFTRNAHISAKHSWQIRQLEGFIERATQKEAGKHYLVTRSVLYEVQSIYWRQFLGEPFLRVLRSFSQQLLGKALILFLNSCTGSSVA